MTPRIPAHSITRKQFLRSALGVGAGAFGLTLLGCGSNSSPSRADAPAQPPIDAPRRPTDAAPDAATAMASCTDHGTNSTIGSNHGHILVVSKADVVGGVAKTYHIQGTATHDHTVSLTAADFQMLQHDHAIMTNSSVTDGHAHSIMVACAT
jgi:hypothetical protein